MKRTTGEYDKNGKEIFEGNKLKGKNFDGEITVFNVRWSEFYSIFIGDNPDEIFDISESIFNQYEIIE